MLDHYVAFQVRPGREKDLTDALREFGEGIASLECLHDFTYGKNISESGLGHGYTHGLFVRLTSEQALKTDYWNHSAHQRLLGILDDVCADRFAVDYEVPGGGSGSGR
jgi:stress responsive alpha/beta barrel protein